MNPWRVTSNTLTKSLLLLSIILFGAVPAGAQDDSLITTPPPGPVRIPGEFEPTQAVIIDWLDFADPVLYASLAEDVKMIFFVPVSKHKSVRELVEESFAEHGISTDNCEFIDIPFPGVPYQRDVLPWFMFVNGNDPAFVFNLLPEDNWSPPVYGLEQGYPVYRSGLNIQGGDFMTDGQGTAISLARVVRNHEDMGQGFLERIWDYWGVHRYLFIDDEGTNYTHTDCAAKLLSPDTIMIPRFQEFDDRYEQSEAAVAYLRRQVSCYGTPYNLVRVDAPNREPYINSLIVNRRVYVPIDGVDADAAALASYEAAMPGYEVIGITQKFSANHFGTLWSSGAALHCSSLGIADEQMLYIEHIPLLDRPPMSEGFPIRAKIIAHSQTEFVDGTPVVWWRASEDPNALEPGADPNLAWNSLVMTSAPELGDDQYLAYIPAQPVGTVVQYYLQAKDESGRDETHPYIGQPQAHTFTVTTLGTNVSAVSAQRGGVVEIYMNAGLDNARQNYRLTYSIPTDPNLTEHPHETLPDATVLTGIEGQLDESGTASAQMILPAGLESDWAVTTIDLSLELPDQQNAVLETMYIKILE